MPYLDLFDPVLFRDPYEVSEAVRKIMEPKTRQFMGMKVVILSNPHILPPGIVGWMSSGPEPEQNVWVRG